MGAGYVLEMVVSDFTSCKVCWGLVDLRCSSARGVNIKLTHNSLFQTACSRALERTGEVLPAANLMTEKWTEEKIYSNE